MTRHHLRAVTSFRLVPADRATRDAELHAHWQASWRARRDMQFLTDHLGTLIGADDAPDREAFEFAQFDANLALASVQRLVDALAQCHALLPDHDPSQPSCPCTGCRESHHPSKSQPGKPGGSA